MSVLMKHHAVSECKEHASDLH